MVAAGDERSRRIWAGSACERPRTLLWPLKQSRQGKKACVIAHIGIKSDRHQFAIARCNHGDSGMHCNAEGMIV
jgi:hypothetical protein